MKNNFICDCCGKEFCKNKYSSVLVEGKLVDVDSVTKQPFRCDNCEEGVLVGIAEKVDWSKGCANVATVGSMTPQQRSEVLIKRSRKHYKEKVEEEKRDILKRSGFNPDT